MDDLYLDTLIDRYRNPTNKGWIGVAEQGQTIEVRKAQNVSCGDKFEVAFLLKDGRVLQASWRGEGCAISTVSTDTFCEWAVGKTVEQVLDFSYENIQELTGISNITPAREKCVLIPLRLEI